MPVSLTNIEFAIVELLMNNPDAVFSKRVAELCRAGRTWR